MKTGWIGETSRRRLQQHDSGALQRAEAMQRNGESHPQSFYGCRTPE